MTDQLVNKFLNLKGILYVAGNGGSAAIANHLACDFMKVGIPTVSLASNDSLLTMIANDYGYDSVFYFQLDRLLKPDDMVLMVSSSGKSINVIMGAQLAKDKKVPVISFTGFTGGKLKELSDINFHVDSHDYGDVECKHTIFFHVIAKKISERKAC